MPPTRTNPPTRKQLSYLRSLAERNGQTFTYPASSREPSAEINRLRAAAPSNHRPAREQW